MVCPKCGFSHDVDVIACMSSLDRLVGDCPTSLNEKPMSLHPETSNTICKGGVETNPLEATQKEPKLTWMVP